MYLKLKEFLRPLALLLLALGFDPRKLCSLWYLKKYKKDKGEWLKQGGKITKSYMILSDYSDNAGSQKGHYFHQDLLVAKLINKENPKRHVDRGSRIDGFVAHVASFRKIEVFDVRPLPKSEHQNIIFRQLDLMVKQDLGKSDSVSCLHAIEHFGLGRYSDKIDINGHNKGITNLVNMVSDGGKLYISFPIGQKDEVHFNAHRVFNVHSILEHPSIKKYMKLVRFDYVDDYGHLHLDVNIIDVKVGIRFGCGIYTFQKVEFN